MIPFIRIKIQSMKKVTASLLFLFPLFTFSQKSVDLDKFRFSVQFRSLPAVRIDSTYRTYNVEMKTTKLMNPLLQEMDPENSVRMEGWKKLSDQGHITVKVNIGDLVPGDVTVKERVVTSKNGNGVITGTKTYYYQEVAYTFEAEAVITDYKGMHIMDEQLSNRSYKRVYRSPEFTNRVIAAGYFLANSLAVTKELFRESVTNAMHRLNERLNRNFGYEPVTVNDMMWVIDSRKHPEYDGWRNAIRQINDVLFELNAYTPANDARQKAQPAINYFEKIKNLYPSNNRHDRKLRYGCYYNLAVLYYYLDDPQAMMKEANGLELNDFDSKDAKGFKETAAWLKRNFEQNNIYTRHFPVDIESLKGPFEKADVSVK
jgi:hypothetical protein